MSSIDSQFDGYSEALSDHINDVIISNDQEEIKKIRKLFNNESWESIVLKFTDEGSTWIVWWMDGVSSFMKEKLINP
jgi:hypothetical protein